MTPINFEITESKFKVTVTLNGKNGVQSVMIVTEVDHDQKTSIDIEVTTCKVKVTTTFNIKMEQISND